MSLNNFEEGTPQETVLSQKSFIERKYDRNYIKRYQEILKHARDTFLKDLTRLQKEI